MEAGWRWVLQGAKGWPKVNMFLGVDSFFILFSHGSFQKPAVSNLGFWWFPEKKDPWKEWGRYPRIFTESARRKWNCGKRTNWVHEHW